MDLGLSPKLQAWVRVATLTIGTFMAAYQGAASDEWASSAEWISVIGATILTFLGALSGAPKDARSSEAKTRSTDG